jgi:queuine tRNA-ribosyltransferase
MQASEALSGTLSTIHNLAYYFGIMQRVRNSFEAGSNADAGRLTLTSET